MSDIYSISVRTNALLERSMSGYREKVLLIVNTASKCRFTPQLDSIEKLYSRYREKGFEVLAFPCNQFMKQDPGTNSEIKEFCSLKFGTTFQIFDKIDVNGPDASPLFKYLKSQRKGILCTESIKWNFTKFLVDRNGNVVKRYAPITRPEKMEREIIRLLGE